MSVSAYAGETPKMPYETGKAGPTEADVAKSLFDVLDSGEEHPVEDEPEGGEEAAESEDESEEAEEAAEEEAEDESAEDEESDDGDGEEPELHEVTAPGGKKEKVTLDELKKGYSRHADYTRKTTAIAAREKELDTEKGQIAESRTKYVEGIKQIETALKQFSPEVDWDKMQEEDPEGFPLAWAQHQRRAEAMKKLSDAREAEEAKQTEEQRTKFEKYRKEQQDALLEALPVLKDRKKGPVFYQQLCDYLQGEGLGFTPEQLGNVVDHRLWVIGEKARRFDELMAKGKDKLGEKIKQAPKTLPPGSRTARQGGQQRGAVAAARQMDRLKKTGSEKDALPLIQQILGN